MVKMLGRAGVLGIALAGIGAMTTTAHGAPNPGYRGELLSFDLAPGSIDFQPNRLSNTGLVGGYISTGLVNQERVGVYDGSSMLWSQDFVPNAIHIDGMDDQGRMRVSVSTSVEPYLVDADGVQHARTLFVVANPGHQGAPLGAGLSDVNASGHMLFTTEAGVFITDRDGRITAGPLQGPEGVSPQTLRSAKLSGDGNVATIFDPATRSTYLAGSSGYLRTVHDGAESGLTVNPMGVNSAGEVAALMYGSIGDGVYRTRVGYFDSTGDRTIFESFEAYPGSLNELGQSIVVGFDLDVFGMPILLDRGELLFLNDLPLQLPDGVTGVTLLIDLNDHGQILVQGEHESLGQVYMVLTPLPAPGGVAVLGFAGLLAVRRRR